DAADCEAADLAYPKPRAVKELEHGAIAQGEGDLARLTGAADLVLFDVIAPRGRGRSSRRARRFGERRRLGRPKHGRQAAHDLGAAQEERGVLGDPSFLYRPSIKGMDGPDAPRDGRSRIPQGVLLSEKSAELQVRRLLEAAPCANEERREHLEVAPIGVDRVVR